MRFSSQKRSNLKIFARMGREISTPVTPMNREMVRKGSSPVVRDADAEQGFAHGLVKLLGVAFWMAAAAVLGGCPDPSTSRLPQHGAPSQQSPTGCSADALRNASFAGIYNGRAMVLHIQTVEQTEQTMAFTYTATLDGDRGLQGTGTIDAVTCEGEIGTFDSRARLIRTNRGWALQSVEPAWRLVSAREKGDGE